MKRFLSLAAVLLFLSSSAFAAVIEDWSYVIPNMDIGTYADTKGSRIDFTIEAGPCGAKAVKLTSKIVHGGWCGIWRNLYADLSGDKSLQFKVKSNTAGEVEIGLTDGYDVQYTTRFTVFAKDWTEVTVPLSSFNKNSYYTAPDAVMGHPMDLTTIKAMSFSSQIAGDSAVEIGPVEAVGTASDSAAAAVPATGSIVKQNNADFSQGKQGWYLWTNQTGKGEFEAVDGRAQVKITDPGTLIWSLGLANPYIKIEKDRMYKVEFEARSSPPINLKSLVQLNKQPYTEYSGFRYFKLTENNKKYSYTFIMRHDTDPAAAFEFECGGQIKSIITLGNVKIFDMGSK